MMVCRLFWLILGGESIGDIGDEGGGGVGGDDVYTDKTEPMLVLVSDSYSDDEIISICDSRPSSCPAYTITDYFIYQLLP